MTELLDQLARNGRRHRSYRERIPYAALAAQAKDEAPAAAMPVPVRRRLGREGLIVTVRVIAAVEDPAEGRILQMASFLKHLRESLPLNAVSPLSNGKANRLLREEFIELGYLRTVPVQDIDLATGDRFAAERYRLNREHPAVRNILARETPTLKQEREIHPFAATPEEIPTAG